MKKLFVLVAALGLMAAVAQADHGHAKKDHGHAKTTKKAKTETTEKTTEHESAEGHDTHKAE